jgi:arylsulfatase A-like enzyme
MKSLLTLIISSFLIAPILYGQSKPNIIYIYADDLGIGELGCYGQQKIKTPNLDQMAKEGMRFTQHYSGAPVCAPSRCMLLTGMHAGHSYIKGNYELGGFPDSLEGGQMPIPQGTFTIGHLMKQAGYQTAVIGKWGLGMVNTSGHPLQQGFDYFYGYLDQKQAHNYYPTHLWENEHWDTLRNQDINVHRKLDPATATDADFNYFKGKDYAPDKMTEKALKFIDKNSKQPFFLYLPYTIPHVSLQLPDAYVKKYIGQFNEQPYYGQKGYASTKYPLSTYAGMISYLDEQVGIIMKKIKDLGLDNNTIILFSSDNGASFAGGVDHFFFNSTAGLRGEKMDLYEGGIREPFLVRWPGKIKAGAVSDHVSTQYDLMATLAAITGQKTPTTDGISFLPTLNGEKQTQKEHDYLYFEYPEKGGQLAIRLGNWKAVKLEVRQHPENAWQLFDLSKDPFEQNDIAKQNSAMIQKMEAIVKKEHRHAHVQDWEFVDPKFPVKNINQ